MIKLFTTLQNQILGVFVEAPFPLRSAVDIAAEINRVCGAMLNAMNIAGSVGGLRKAGLIVKRKIYQKHISPQVYVTPYGYVCHPYKTYWFLARRENEVYPLKAGSYFRRDLRR